MGVNFKDLINFQNITLEDLCNKKIAFDAHNTIYQFLTTIRQADGTPLKDINGNITSHLSGLFYRITNLLRHGIKPCFVFDGKPPEFKLRTLAERKERKIKAAEEFKKALKKGLFDMAKTKAAQSTRMTSDIIEESKELIQALGLPVVQAPSEGEAQAAFLVKRGDCFAVSSQDYDSLLFDATVLIRNLNITGKRKLPGKNIYIKINPQIAYLKNVYDLLGINREQLIIVGMLIGTDFNKGVKGVGPKTALKKVKKFKTLKNVIKELNWKEDNLEEIFNFFKNPPVSKNYSLKWTKVDKKKIFKILVEKHNFSESRVNNTLNKLSVEMERKTQTSLLKF